MTNTLFFVGIAAVVFALILKKKENTMKVVGIVVGLIIAIGGAAIGNATGNEWYWLGALIGFCIFAVSAVG